MKHTHKAHCQACGRMQAVKGKVLAKHGYKVKGFGFFMGTCQGSGKLPMEVERTLTDSVLVELKAYENVHTRSADQYESGTLLPTHATTGKYIRTIVNGVQKSVPEVVPFAEAEAYRQKLAVSEAVRRHRFEASQAKIYHAFLIDLLATVHGKAMIAVDHDANKPVEVAIGATFHLKGKEYTVKSFASGGFSSRTNYAWIENEGRKFKMSLRQIRAILKPD